MKRILFVVTVLLTITVYASAYENGDSVRLSPNAKKYETGEAIPRRYVGRVYLVRQKKSKWHPNAILLRELYSWIYLSDIEDANDRQYDIDGSEIEVLGTGNKYSDINGVSIPSDSINISVTPIPDSDTIIQPVSTDTIIVEAEPMPVVEPENAGYSKIGIGLRGGVASFLQNAGNFGEWYIGYGTFIDLQYTYLFKRRDVSKPFCGIKTGVSVGFTSSDVLGIYHNQYTTADVLGDRLDYTIDIDKSHYSFSQVQLQIPLHFSLLYKRMFFNLGPKFVLPLYSPYCHSLNNPHIKAYYEPYDVLIEDKAIIGVFSKEQIYYKSKWNSPLFQLYISTEIGYDFALKGGNSLGIGIYASYCIYNTFKGIKEVKDMVTISQIGSDPDNPLPSVTVLPLMDSYLKGIGYFDVGIKLIYSFSFYK